MFVCCRQNVVHVTVTKVIVTVRILDAIAIRALRRADRVAFVQFHLIRRATHFLNTIVGVILEIFFKRVHFCFISLYTYIDGAFLCG